jgi:hypothetical protein
MNQYNKMCVKEKKWCEKLFKKFNGCPTQTQFEQEGLDKIYSKKFKLPIESVYRRIYNSYARQQRKAGRGMVGSKNPKKTEKVLEKSNYLVYVRNAGVSGFDNEEEVKEFIKSGVVIGKLEVFKKIPVAIECKVTLG